MEVPWLSIKHYKWLTSACTLLSCPNASSFVQNITLIHAVDYAIFYACKMCNGNISGLHYVHLTCLFLKRTNSCPSCQFHQVHRIL